MKLHFVQRQHAHWLAVNSTNNDLRHFHIFLLRRCRQSKVCLSSGFVVREQAVRMIRKKVHGRSETCEYSLGSCACHLRRRNTYSTWLKYTHILTHKFKSLMSNVTSVGVIKIATGLLFSSLIRCFKTLSNSKTQKSRFQVSQRMSIEFANGYTGKSCAHY